MSNINTISLSNHTRIVVSVVLSCAFIAGAVILVSFLGIETVHAQISTPLPTTECGTKVGTYPATQTDWTPGTKYCAHGVETKCANTTGPCVSFNFPFPAPGESVQWKCSIDGGATYPTGFACKASVEPAVGDETRDIRIDGSGNGSGKVVDDLGVITDCDITNGVAEFGGAGGDCRGTYKKGHTNKVTLTATPAPGSKFVGFTDEGSGNDCADGILSMSTHHVCIARFDKVNTPPPTAASCPKSVTDNYNPGQGDILIDLTKLPKSAVSANPNAVISNGNLSQATRGPMNFAVPAGNFKVTLVGFDDHVSHPGQNQPNERYRLDFIGNTTVSSGVTDDLIDDDKETYVTTVVNSSLSIPSGISQVKVFHGTYPDNSSPNSIEPVCALLEPVKPSEITCLLTADPTSFPHPGGDSTLTWTSTNADTVVFSPNISVPAGQVNGSKTVSVTNTTVYSATFTGPSGTKTCTATVTVGPPADAPSCDLFKADPVQIPKGGSTTLTWETTNADNVSIEPGIGKVPLDGSRVVTDIQKTTTYTLTASANGLSATCNATVRVLPPPDPGECPIKPINSGDIVINFKTFFDDNKNVVANKGALAAQTGLGEISAPSITPGKYKVRLASFDDHTGHPGQNQKNEKWFLRLRSNVTGLVVGQSAPTPDLPEEPINAAFWEVNGANNPMEVKGFSADAKGIHALWSKDNPYPDPESVRPVCAVLTQIQEERTTLTLEKIVINDDGGTAKVSDFQLFITDINGVTTKMTSGVPLDVAPGSYIASEFNLPGYTASDWQLDCNATGVVTLAEGDHKVCRIINDDVGTPKITKEVTPQEGVPGETVFKYTLRYSNPSNVDVHNLEIDDGISPIGVVGNFKITKDADHNGNPSPEPSCKAVSGNAGITCNLGTLPAGDSGTVEYTGEALSGGEAENTACIEEHGPGVDIVHDCDDEIVVVDGIDIVDVSIEKLVRNKDGQTDGESASGKVNDKFIYTLSYKNEKPTEAVNVVIVDDLAATGIVEILEIKKDADHIKNMMSKACKVIKDNNVGVGIECMLGNLPGGAMGTVEYEAKGIDDGVVDNFAHISADNEDPNFLFNNDDDARVTITGNPPQADVEITKSVTPSSQKKGNVFTYTLSYGNIGNIKAEDVTIDDVVVDQGFLDTFTITKDPDHGTCDPINATTGELHCDLGDLNPGDSGTIKYTAVGIKDGSVKNEVVIKTPTPETIDEDDNPTNNRDDAVVTITSGGGSSGGGSSGSSGRRRPNVVLFSEPEVAGVSLVSVPYTGVGDVVQIILYFLALLGVAGVITYTVFKYRARRKEGKLEHATYRAAETIIERPMPAPRSPLASNVMPPAIFAEQKTEEPEARIESPMSAPKKEVNKDNGISAALEARAQAMRVLVSADGREVIVQSADNNKAKALTTLERVVSDAEKKFAREDGWLLLNRTRVEEVLFSKSLSTVPLFVQWLVQGNQQHIFSFVRSLSQQGRSPEEFVQQVVAALDAVYQSRVDGISTNTDPSVAELVEKLSREELESMIINLTRGIDGGYRSILDGVKVAVTRIFNERAAGQRERENMPEAPKRPENKAESVEEDVASVDWNENS